jgi:two-component system CheB/CheR fusion protein
VAKKTTARAGRGRAGQPKQSKAPGASPEDGTAVPIVAVGASAGGLEAFKGLLRHLPTDTGMAFILVQHLDPHRESMLVELLGRQTRMPVLEAGDGMRVESNHVYVIPPDRNLAVLHGELQLLKPISDEGHKHLPVDYLLRSLAEEAGPAAIGVILSGTASDGTLGLKAIKASGGVTFAQDEHSAQYYGMPGSAVASGCVDFVLPPAEIARELTRIARHPYLLERGRVGRPELLPGSGEQLTKVFTLLRARTGHDFTYYKQATIKRRIRRRMLLHKLDRLGDYLDYLQANQEEIDALFHDITINVTGFFREPETFEALRDAVLPRLVKGRVADAPLRIWVPGCSTGEETYSLAMVILEHLGTRATEVPVQIFGTDIDERAVDRARAGVYLERITADVSSERLKRFFTEVSGGYQISKTIRDMCVFAPHDVTRDPPFSKLDLVCCRNVLIYLGSTLQRRVVQIFHYALKPGGFLMLGSSESIGASADLFQLEHKEGKIYAKKTTANMPTYDFAARPYQLENPRPIEVPAASRSPESDLRKEADRVVVARYGPAGVIVNQEMDVLGFRGKTGRYLEPTPGVASLNLLKLLRQELVVDLRNTFNRALKGEVEAAREGLRLRHNGHLELLDLRVLPLKGATRERFFLILFEDRGRHPAAPAPDKGREEAEHKNAGGAITAVGARIRELEQELHDTRAYMQSVIEDQESTNEELQSANEEIQSTNEELQSTNEELETAKEELQSTNEELATVNEELENRNAELTASNNDLKNLLASVNLPILMLDQNLKVRRFTPQAKRLLNLIDTDVGRPIGNIRPNVELPELERLAREVMDSMSVKTQEVSDKHGNPYSVSVRPYKTHDQRIDGVVITFFEHAQFDRLSRLATVVRDANDAVAVLDLGGRFRAWNPVAERLYGYSEREALGQGLEAIVPEEEMDATRSLLDRARRGERIPPQRVRRRTKEGKEVEVWLTLSLMVDRTGAPKALSTIELPVLAAPDGGASGR